MFSKIINDLIRKAELTPLPRADVDIGDFAEIDMPHQRFDGDAEPFCRFLRPKEVSGGFVLLHLVVNSNRTTFHSFERNFSEEKGQGATREDTFEIWLTGATRSPQPPFGPSGITRGRAWRTGFLRPSERPLCGRYGSLDAAPLTTFHFFLIKRLRRILHFIQFIVVETVRTRNSMSTTSTHAVQVPTPTLFEVHAWYEEPSVIEDMSSWDAEIETAVGRSRDGSGAGFGYRDLQWQCETREEAESIALKIATIPGVKVEIIEIKDEDDYFIPGGVMRRGEKDL